MSHPCKVFQYSIKFVGGLARPVDQQALSVVAPGWYFTAINIFNPARCQAVTFRWHGVGARPFDTRPGGITTPRELTLRPGAGVEIDTHHVIGGNPPRLHKGFVVIESPCELDIVAVYSAAPPSAGHIGGVVAFHTERVAPRVVEACDDLELDLSTGVFPWTIIRATNAAGAPLPNLTTPRPAWLIESGQPGAWINQPGARWISTNAGNVTSGVYTFRACFSLCAGFGPIALDLSTLTDNAAQVLLNGAVVQTTGVTSFTGPPSTAHLTTGFLPGRNCLEVVVRNDGTNPMGLNLRALLRAAHGACDCGCACSGCDEDPPVRRAGPGEPALDREPGPAAAPLFADEAEPA